jgi:hypothetical protein
MVEHNFNVVRLLIRQQTKIRNLQTKMQSFQRPKVVLASILYSILTKHLRVAKVPTMIKMIMIWITFQEMGVKALQKCVQSNIKGWWTSGYRKMKTRCSKCRIRSVTSSRKNRKKIFRKWKNILNFRAKPSLFHSVGLKNMPSHYLCRKVFWQFLTKQKATTTALKAFVYKSI